MTIFLDLFFAASALIGIWSIESAVRRGARAAERIADELVALDLEELLRDRRP